jgi:hypothetical protein
MPDMRASPPGSYGVLGLRYRRQMPWAASLSHHTSDYLRRSNPSFRRVAYVRVAVDAPKSNISDRLAMRRSCIDFASDSPLPVIQIAGRIHNKGKKETPVQSCG